MVNQNINEVISVMDALSRIKHDYLDTQQNGRVAEFSWLPGYLIKLNPEMRIKGAADVEKCIQDHNLCLIKLPRQLLYCIPENLHRLTELRTLCISEKLEGKLGARLELNLEQTRELIELAKTCLGDMKWQNLVHCPDGTIGIIDTEYYWGPIRSLIALEERNAFTVDAAQLIKAETGKYRGMYMLR